MASVKELLKNTLKDLKEEELKEFKWHLVDYHECIKKNDMENADILDTVDKMVNCFEPEEAVEITVKILKKINQNNLAKQLESKHKQGSTVDDREVKTLFPVSDPLSHTHSSQAEGNMKTFAAVGAHSEEIRATVPKTRSDFLQYHHHFTLDPNTAHKLLLLSEENREITVTGTHHSYPDHPDRFDDVPQVLCRERVCGRCYWEIEWSGDVFISVSYKSISRKGDGTECVFGSNDQSWSLICSPDSYSFRHNNIETKLPVEPISRRTGVCVDPIRRTGVCVDHSAGTLSFYSVSDTVSLLHTVQTTFTQPLYPGIRIYYPGSVKLC